MVPVFVVFSLHERQCLGFGLKLKMFINRVIGKWQHRYLVWRINVCDLILTLLRKYLNLRKKRKKYKVTVTSKKQTSIVTVDRILSNTKWFANTDASNAGTQRATSLLKTLQAIKSDEWEYSQTNLNICNFDRGD